MISRRDAEAQRMTDNDLGINDKGKEPGGRRLLFLYPDS
jgi:hypothetical protein